MTSVAAETDVLRQAFARLEEGRAEPSWLRDARARAMGRFVERGFPSPRDEAWRHTPIGPIVRTRWEPAEGSPRLSRPELRALIPGGFRGAEAVMVGGRLSNELSRLDSGQAGVAVRSLADVIGREPGLVEPHLGRLTDGEASVFADLNTAFATDGVVVVVDSGVVVAEPIHVVHLAAPGSDSPEVSFPRVLVLAGRGSQCRVVETYTGNAEGSHLTLAVTEVEVADNALVDHYRLQRESAQAFHVGTLAARLGRDSRFANRSFNLGAAVSRTDIEVRFEGEGGDCALDGLFMVDGERTSDTHTRIDHARPHCSSRELYKGVLDGGSRGVFHGVVLVRPGAQKTDAVQMNRNLLLSRRALVHSVPQLEILADDVKCRHGSTTGQIDPAALFYLRSRGLDEAEARSLLTWAFASDLVDGLEVEPLRKALLGHIQEYLSGSGIVREVLA